MYKFLLTLLLYPVSLFSQDTLPLKDGEIFFEFIDSIPNTPKQRIYERAMTWVAEAFGNSKVVTRLDDKEQGEYIGKGSNAYAIESGIFIFRGQLHFTFKISVRDGKCRLQMYDWQASNEVEPTPRSIQEFRKMLKKKIQDDFLLEIPKTADMVKVTLFHYLKKTDNF